MSINYDKYINSTGTHFISNSGGDSKGGISGDTPGDQNKKEWQLRSWYNRPWSVILRHPDPKVRRLIAELAIEGALNDKIGYSQTNRASFWKQLKVSGYRPANITKACDEDCSAGVNSIVKAVGYLLNIEKLKNVSYANTSRNTKSGLKAAGFQVLTESKYRTSGKYLLPGDVLLYENHHVATNITRGSKAVGEVASSVDTNSPTPSTPAQDSVDVNVGVIGTAVARQDMNIRSEPNIGSKSIDIVNKGAILNVVMVLINGWYKVQWNNGYAYTSNSDGKYYTYTPKPPVKNAQEKPKSENATMAGFYTTTGNLNMRNGAGSNNTVLTIIPTGKQVESNGQYTEVDGTKWLYVRYQNCTGFCSIKYLKSL